MIDLDKTKLFGLTHAKDGRPLTRDVRMLKVGIGYPKGPAVHIYIDRSNKWVIEEGVKQNGKWKITHKRLETRKEAEELYKERRLKAADRAYPAKTGYFTFQRIGRDGSYFPDFDAIEQHGPVPIEITILFLSNVPLEQSMQWWTAAELKCEGNGIDARRRIELAETEDEKRLAEKAKTAGEKFFPIKEGCATCGCPYPMGDKPVCKTHSRLNFQLAHAPTIGGTCTYDTTGKRSGANLFSCLQQIRTITGRGNPDEGVVAGIPLQLIVRPYRSSFKGKPTTQYAVSLQLRAQDAVSLYRNVLTAGDEFRQLTAGLEPPSPPVIPESVEAKVMEAEFYPTEQGGHDEDEAPWAGSADAGFEMPRRKSDAAAEEKPEEPAPPTETEMREATQAALDLEEKKEGK